MEQDIGVLRQIYACFNARNIDGVLALLADNVIWANGMDGGHVHGHAAVRAYWMHQWSMVDPTVEPAGFRRTPAGTIVAEVRQTVRDLEGRPLQDQAHGLADKTVQHVFHLQNGKITRFDIGDAA